MPHDPITRIESARGWLEAGRPDRAARLLFGTFPDALRGEALLVRAETQRARGYFRKAQSDYRASLKALTNDERDLVTAAQLGLARCARSLGEIAPARRAMRAARAASGRPDKGMRELLSLESALVDRAEGLYARSLARLQPLLASARRDADHSAVGFILWAMGGARRFSGDLTGAHRDFRASLRSFTRSRDREGQVYALFGLGGIARVRGLFAEARAAYAKAGALLGRGPDVFGRAYAHCGLANVLRQLGLLSQAERHYHLSYALYSKLDDRVDLAYVDWGLGQIQLKRGDLPSARRRLRAALDAFARHGEARGEALSLHSLAQVSHALGRTADAERLFDAAVVRSRRAGLHAHLEVFT